MIKTKGTFKGKSNKLGYGGRSAQLKAQGVPGGGIGMLARKAQAAPGQKNFHGANSHISKSKLNQKAGHLFGQKAKPKKSVGKRVKPTKILNMMQDPTTATWKPFMQ